MAISDNETFCVLPFTHMNTTTGGLYRFCCIVEQPNKDINGNPITLHGHKLQDAWNSEEMAAIRLKMIAGEKVAPCKKCYYEESHGSRSLRKDYNENWLNNEKILIDARIKEAQENNGKLESDPIFVELKFSNLCNIKCRMCSPFDSSVVQKEYEKIASTDSVFDSLWSHRHKVLFNPKMKLSDLPVWHDDPEKVQQFLDLVPTLKKLHFAGGEPTLHNQFYQLLDQAIDSGYAKNIELSFNTNLTQVSSDLIQKLSQFKTVLIHASIDGFENVQEYIRYPTKWSIIVQNLQKLLELGDHCHILISPTVQLYNVFELVDLFRFVDELNRNNRKQISITPGILDNPSYLNFRILPLRIRQQAADIWKRYASEITGPSWWKSRVLTVASVIEDPLEQNNSQLIANFLSFTSSLDKNRGQRFQDVYPKLFEELTNGGDYGK